MAALARKCAGLPSGQWHATFRSGSVPQKLLAALASRLRANVQTEAASVNLVSNGGKFQFKQAKHRKE